MLKDKIHTNEREFQSQTFAWFGELLAYGNYPFDKITGEFTVRQYHKGVLFPDITVWINHQSRDCFCVIELKRPEIPPDDKDLLKNAKEKAIATNSHYFATWNMRDLIIWKLNEQTKEEKIYQYSPLPIGKVEDWIGPQKQEMLRARAEELLNDLAKLYHDGYLYYTPMDSFFIRKIINVTKTIVPLYKDALLEIRGKDKKKWSKIMGWVLKQGFLVKDSEKKQLDLFLDIVSRQIVYQFIGRLFFCELLKKSLPHDLPAIDLSKCTPEMAMDEFQKLFEEVKSIDYQAVFESDIPDEIDIPKLALTHFQAILDEFKEKNFGNLPQEVLGNIFENLIPVQERHRLGQYFTDERLCDIINGFCIPEKNKVVCDPTCGSGTFLVRAYERLKCFGQTSHQKLLSQLWGIDIAPFPAELTTINLYRQKIQEHRNFPRVIKKDFFEVKVGEKHLFPPNRLDKNNVTEKIEEVIPLFDAIVGNFPYIRQHEIEKGNKNYRSNIILPAIIKNWGDRYPDIFSKGDLKLTGHADIYAYMFLHAGAMLIEGGRMGIVTSNAWLDVNYGHELQKFFLNNFKVVAILESRCDPWFPTVKINTIATILERCSSKNDRNNNIVRFVKVKQKLKDLIPKDSKYEAPDRQHTIDILVQSTEDTVKTAELSDTKDMHTVETPQFRIRLKRQKELLKEVTKSETTVKWGIYLRAPKVYFDLLKSEKFERLASYAHSERGLTTNNTDFFYLTDEEIKKEGIEKRFIVKNVIYSPKEVPNIAIDIKKLTKNLFCCDLSRSALKGTKAFNYILKAEKKRINRSASFRGNEEWYRISKKHAKPYSVSYARHDVYFRTPFNPKGYPVNDNLYVITPHSDKDLDHEFLNCLLNSAFYALSLELSGRLNLGDGALKVQTYEVILARIPRPELFSVGKREKLRKLFEPIRKRKIKTIFDEIRMPDRRKFDFFILKTLGLGSEELLNRMYDGICTLVRERIELGQKRVQIKQRKVEVDRIQLQENAISEIFPDSVKVFPDQFTPANIGYKELNIPKEKFKLGTHFFGKWTIITDKGFKYEAASIYEAKYLIYSQRKDVFSCKIPTDSRVTEKVVKKYEKYVDSKFIEMYCYLFKRLRSDKESQNMAIDMFLDLGLLRIKV